MKEGKGRREEGGEKRGVYKEIGGSKERDKRSRNKMVSR